MINLLIVDDEQLEIEGIKATLDFHQLGIQEVFEASNIRQAKELFSNQAVGIMLCDIEMPQGNGLELLMWVKENHPRTECVFITCHTDFKYAKQAIQLGSLDYLLKPAQPEELGRVLLTAIENIHKASQMIVNTRFSKLWLKHQPLMIEHFWRSLLKHKIPSNYEEICKAALDINFPGLEGLKVFPILIRMQRFLPDLDAKDEKHMEFELKSRAVDLILKGKGNGIMLDIENGGILGLIYLEASESINQAQLKQECSTYIHSCHRELGCELSCYLGCVVNSYDLIKVVESLVLMDKNNVVHTNKVLTLCSCSTENSSINLPDMSAWVLMMEERGEGELKEEISKLQQSLMKAEELNANVLHQIQQDYVQMMGLFLKEKGIQAHQLFSDEQSVELFRKATASVRNLTDWMVQGIEKALWYVAETEKYQSVIGRVKRYITQNIDQELTCEEIASKVFLNPIYLSRIFKKEIGVSLSEYLQQERLKIAQELLSKTNMPINIVAARVGYSNFSHFSRMFRKHTGLSPVDFRKTNRLCEGAK